LIGDDRFCQYQFYAKFLRIRVGRSSGYSERECALVQLQFTSCFEQEPGFRPLIQVSQDDVKALTGHLFQRGENVLAVLDLKLEFRESARHPARRLLVGGEQKRSWRHHS